MYALALPVPRGIPFTDAGTRTSPIRVKVIMFKCLVYEAAVLGWTAAAPSRTGTMALDSIALAFARKLLGERACKRTQLSQPVASAELASLEECSYRRVSESSVWRHVRIAPVAAELRVGRINWRCVVLRAIFARAATSQPRYSARWGSTCARRYRGVRLLLRTLRPGLSSYMKIYRKSSRILTAALLDRRGFFGSRILQPR